MAADPSSSSSVAPPLSTAATAPSSSRGRARRSVHLALGGGSDASVLVPVADVLLWRRRSAAAAAAACATAFWYFFERAGYSFLSVVANALLLLVAILFFWAKSALLLNRPLPPLPNLEVSDEVVEKAANEARVWINRVLAIGHDIAIKRDRKVFLEVILVLWLVSYIGRFFNFLTVVYIGILLSLTVPALYDKYQDHVDEKLGIAHSLFLKQYDNILSKTGESRKEKKTQ
ncbi:Reticulon-like protein B11 [Ananas comosus]|uniref:Reticulon-like protein n=2 Tax=Ananas comosus TaxID=4615 RepID=A0A199UPA5_ANACO|nr:Reticulon-like protein B11 [Ananas comosus]